MEKIIYNVDLCLGGSLSRKPKKIDCLDSNLEVDLAGKGKEKKKNYNKLP